MVEQGWTITAIGCVLLAGGGVLAEPPSLIGEPEDGRSRSLLTRAADEEHESLPDYLLSERVEPELLLSGLSLDVGVTRMGEVSRALEVDGVLEDLAGAGLEPQTVTINGVSGPVRVYDAAVEWDATDSGPVRVSVLGGVRAFGLSRGWTGVPGARLGLDDSASDEIVPVPVLGGSMSLALSEDWQLSGRAASRAVSDGGTYIDLSAESAWTITPRMRLIAGYHFFNADVAGDETIANLRSDGLYAQFKLLF